MTTAVVLIALLVVTVTGVTAAVRRREHITRLTETAKTGLADARVAIAARRYSAAQSLLSEVRGQLAGEPRLMAQLGPKLEQSLREVEGRLRVQRFHALADQARFSTMPLFLRRWSILGTRESVTAHTAQARRECREALLVFGILNDPEALKELDDLRLTTPRLNQLKHTIAELLFLSAYLEQDLATNDGDRASAIRRAIDYLDRVEVLAPKLRALYEYRGDYWRALGNQEAARGDAQRAQTMQRTTWLDHYLHAIALQNNQRFAEATREIQQALVLRIDDYWSWYLWGVNQQWLVGHEPQRWAMSVCIGLRPQEPAAWIGRAMAARFLGDHKAAVADTSKVLELTTDPWLRAEAYRWRGSTRRNLGQLDAALADFNRAIELGSWDIVVYYGRARCYRALGNVENMKADSRRILEKTESSTGNFWVIRYRMWAYELLEQPQREVNEALKLYRNEEFGGWVDHLEDVLKRESKQQTALERFVIAMAYWKLGDSTKAREWYGRGVTLMEDAYPDDPHLRIFRAEAEQLLGISAEAVKPKQNQGGT